MLAPAILILVVFFFAPLWYVFAYSTGLRTFAATKVLAELNGELTSFSFDIWRGFLGRGRRSSTSSAPSSRCRSGSWR